VAVHGLSAMDKITDRLRELKVLVISWDRAQKKARLLELAEIEFEMALIYQSCASGIFTKVEQERINNLEGRKLVILRILEEEWRLKIRAIWLKGGDNNTIFSTNLPTSVGYTMPYGT